MCPVLHLYVLFITDQYQKMFYLYLTNIKKNIRQAILVGKCCHCRINIYIYITYDDPDNFQWTYIQLLMKPYTSQKYISITKNILFQTSKRVIYSTRYKLEVFVDYLQRFIQQCNIKNRKGRFRCTSFKHYVSTMQSISSNVMLKSNVIAQIEYGFHFQSIT